VARIKARAEFGDNLSGRNALLLAGTKRDRRQACGDARKTASAKCL